MAISETTLLLRLPKHLKKEIQAEAKRKGLSVNGLVRLALIQWLRQESLKANLEEDVARRKKGR
ncbi:hypothetical protein ES703_45945 [subsurface metagenome]